MALTDRQIEQRRAAGKVSQSLDTRIKSIEANLENLSDEQAARLDDAVKRWHKIQKTA